MNTKREANRSVRATRRRLCGALVQLLAEKPVRQITVRELTRLARVSRGTFYFHYRDIYELLDHLEEEQIAQLNRFMDALLPRLGSGADEIPPAVLALFEYLDENDAICAALLGPHGDPAFVVRLQRVIAARCMGYLAPGGSTAQQRYLTAFAVRGCFGAIEQWLQQGKPESTARMAQITWQGIRAVERLIAAPQPPEE